MHADLDIFKNRHRFKQADILKRAGNTLGDDAIASQVVQFLAPVGYGAFAGGIYPGDHVKDGCLAGAIGADEAKDPVVRNFKIHLIDGQQTAEPFGHII